MHAAVARRWEQANKGTLAPLLFGTASGGKRGFVHCTAPLWPCPYCIGHGLAKASLSKGQGSGYWIQGTGIRIPDTRDSDLDTGYKGQGSGYR